VRRHAALGVSAAELSPGVLDLQSANVCAETVVPRCLYRGVSLHVPSDALEISSRLVAIVM
jgi:hypothetical protein